MGHTAIMSAGTALSRLTGFLRVAAMAYALGVAESRLADAYNVANTTPNIIYELALGGILSSVFIPVFVEWLESRSREAAWHLARSLMSLAVVVLGTVMILGILGSGLIVRAYTFQVGGPARQATQALASFFLTWFMPQIVFYGVGAIATGLLNAHRRFAVPMFAPILNNLLVSATFIVFALLPGPARPTPSGITGPQRYVLALGTTLGVLAMTAALWPSLRRIGFTFRWTLDLKDPALRRIARLAGWSFVYVVTNQVGYLIVVILAAKQQGGYTAYAAAFIFFQLPHAIFAVSIMTALLPAMSSRWTDGDRDGFRGLLAQGIRATAFVVVPAALGYLVLAEPIVRLLLEHGVAGRASTELVSGVLAMFSVGLFPFSAFQLFLRAFYAMQDTRTPGVINAFAVALNIAVNLVYFPLLGVRGLALGHATAYSFAALAASVILRRRLGGLGGRRVLAGIAQTAVAGAATAAAAFLASRWISARLGPASLNGEILQVLAGVVAGVAAFVSVAAALRMEELAMIKRAFSMRLSRSSLGPSRSA